MSQPEIMTIEEVAQYLRVSERTVYDWVQKKELPGGKLGTVWRFKRSELERWVNARLGDVGRPVDAGGLQLQDVLPPERILFPDAEHKREVLDSLIDCLAETPQVVDRQALAEGIYHRETLMSTGIGLGVAVPHVRLESIRDIIVAAALCRRPLVDYEALDNEPVRLVFMIAAGRNQHTQHIRLLSLISGALKQESLRHALLEAESGEAALALLTPDNV